MVSNSKNNTILSYLPFSPIAKGNVNSSHAPTSVVVANVSVNVPGAVLSSSFNKTLVAAFGDHTFNLKPAFALKSNLASNSIWLFAKAEASVLSI